MRAAIHRSVSHRADLHSARQRRRRRMRGNRVQLDLLLTPPLFGFMSHLYGGAIDVFGMWKIL
jgi:hypothetical protein